jgi:hypothetical protein
MEFRRAYWNETPNGGLVARHQREIFPLLRRRHVFSGVDSFLLYDFYGADGGVNEDVFAYSNRSGEERGLVLYNNRYAEARGWVKTSAAFAVKTGSGKSLVQKCLGEGLALPNEADAFTIFREHLSGLQFIRNCREIWERGVYAELGAFRCQVFLDFSVVRDGAEGRWARLAAELSGRGVPRMDTALREMELRPIRDPLAALLALDPLEASRKGAVRDEAMRRFGSFLEAAERLAAGRIDRKAAAKDFERRSSLLSRGRSHAFLWPWTILRPLCGPGAADSPLPSWIEEWLLAPILRDFLLRAGWDAEAAGMTPALAALLLQAQSLDAEPEPFPWRVLFSDQAAERFLRVNTFEGVRWFGKEALALLLDALPVILTSEGLAVPDDAPVRAAAEKSGYRWDNFLAATGAAPG